MNEIKLFVDHLLDTQYSIFLDVWVEPKKGVILPPHLLHKSMITIQVGRNLAVPIPDLETTPKGLGATLSFNNKGFFCFIPWCSVSYVHVNDGSFKFSLPDNELAKYILSLLEKGPPKTVQKNSNKPRPSHLRLVK